MTEPVTDLTELENCLLSAHVSAASDNRRIAERAVPGLLALADQCDEPRFRAAAEAARVAAKHLEVVRDALRNAGAIVSGTARPGHRP